MASDLAERLVQVVKTVMFDVNVGPVRGAADRCARDSVVAVLRALDDELDSGWLNEGQGPCLCTLADEIEGGDRSGE